MIYKRDGFHPWVQNVLNLNNLRVQELWGGRVVFCCFFKQKDGELRAQK